MKIPDQGGVFPIIAQGEGTRQRCGVVLATEGDPVPKVPVEAKFPAAGLDNTQESRLTAKNPLPERSVERSLPCVLGGNMANYSWTINGFAYSNNNSLNVKAGERVEIVMRNDTGMSHPMHLHGHDVQVIEIDGRKVNGAVRDTLIVPPRSTIQSNPRCEQPWRLGFSLPHPLSSSGWYVYGPEVRGSQYRILAT